MEVAATINPVTYIMEGMRSLILVHFDWAAIGKGFLVVALAGLVMAALNARAIRAYD
jgi:ABC-2 type transport system permease protein